VVPPERSTDNYEYVDTTDGAKQGRRESKIAATSVVSATAAYVLTFIGGDSSQPPVRDEPPPL